jgi:hypothetical protein
MSKEALENEIFDYLDGSMSVDAKSAFEARMSVDEALKQRVNEVRKLEAMTISHLQDMPSKSFTMKVMANLDVNPLYTGISIRNGLMLLAGVLALVGICVTMVVSGVFDTTQTVIEVKQLEVVNKYVETPLPSIPFDGKLFANIVIFLNLIIALIVLDRAVLKPFFQRRAQANF